MKSVHQRIWREDDGVLSFEWVLIITLLVIGIVGGVAATRDAVIDELGDVSAAALCMSQTYNVAPVTDEENNVLAPGFSYTDSFPPVQVQRSTSPSGQTQ